MLFLSFDKNSIMKLEEIFVSVYEMGKCEDKSNGNLKEF